MTIRLLLTLTSGLGSLLGTWTVAALIGATFYFHGADLIVAAILPFSILGLGWTVQDAVNAAAKTWRKNGGA